jgi:hypothetical protein
MSILKKAENILEGWGKSVGLFNVDLKTKIQSNERLNICATSGPGGAICERGKHSNFLKLVNGTAHEIDAIYCDACGCPVNQKTLVTEENCPLNKW